MPRVVKSADVRRNEILDAAYALFVRLGYEATTINLIIDEVGLSKGAFYHHFSSKEEVLHALARRMAEQMRDKLAPLVARRDLSPLDKINLMFGASAQYKREHLPMVRALAHLYYGEENLRLRARITAEGITVIGPLFARILDEGSRDGTFAVDDPVETARLILHLGTFLHDAFGDAWKRARTDLRGAAAQFQRRLDAYTRALENILGLSKHTLGLVDPETLKLFLSPEES
jgi:AcrR family transcriptional regulator